MANRRKSSSVGAFEAKTQLSRLLARVAAGERITITKHGQPVATLGPVSTDAPLDPAVAAKALREFRRGRRLGVPVRELIEEGRRY